MKLYIKLVDDEGQELERLLADNEEGYFHHVDCNETVEDMIDSLKASKKPL